MRRGGPVRGLVRPRSLPRAFTWGRTEAGLEPYVQSQRLSLPKAPSGLTLWNFAGSRAHLRSDGMRKAATATATSTSASTSASLDRHYLLAALRALRKGDFSVRLPIGLTGIDGEIGEAFNDVVELNEQMTKELERLGDVV